MSACLIGIALPAGASDFQGATHLMPFDEDPIRYGKTEATGPIPDLERRLREGQIQLEWEPRLGYLPSLLRELGISAHSQALVFSKTSFQRDRISPLNARAILYNDDIYVGYVPGSPLLEFSMADPKLGGVFYSFENLRTNRPTFVRTDSCLECHATARTLGVPGHLVRSFATDDRGVADLLTGTETITHRTPLTDRWGGWFVTGDAGGQAHRGNLVGPADRERLAQEPGFNDGHQTLADLVAHVRPDLYPAPTSDIGALLVLEHQLHLHNFLTRLQYEATVQLKAYGHCNYIKSPLEAFLRYLLFVEETPLKAPIRSSEAFRRDFEAAGPRDSRGRSLRDLDLQTRLFRYPCSFLIYSPSFIALPDPLKERIYQRLWEILTGKDKAETWQRLTAADRQAIREILVATHPDLPTYWKP